MIVSCNEDGVRQASSIIRDGGTVVFPTDTVYGLGCDPRNTQAVKAVYRIKGRKLSKPFPVLGASTLEIARIAFFDRLSKKIADKFWPGPLTLILRVRDREVASSLNLTNKIAVRVPDHPCALALLKKCKILVGTSANTSGFPPSGNVKEIIGKLEGYNILLDGGKIIDPKESTIIEIIDGQLNILRHGKIRQEDFQGII